MDTNSGCWPSASYFDESSAEGQETLSKLDLVSGESWRLLYRHKVDGSYSALDERDKYQERILARVSNLDTWATEDHSELEKQLLLAHRGGEGLEQCHRSRCGRRVANAAAYCVHHLHEQGVRK